MSKFTKKNNGIKFTPKHLTDEEIEFCKGIVYKGGVVHKHKDGFSGKFVVEMFLPSPKSKEIWAIIYKTTPNKLKGWVELFLFYLLRII